MSEENKDTNKEANLSGDEELNELLDSAIAEFDKPTKVVENPAPEEEPAAQSAEPWDTEFLLEAQKRLEGNVKALFEGGGSGSNFPLNPEEFSSQLQKLAEEADKVFSEREIDPEFSATLAQSLRSLSDDAGNIQTHLDPEALSSMLGDLNLGAGEGTNDLLPFMQTMMRSFLSKDLLYPSFKDICSKYPTWIEENKANLSTDEVDKYTKQYNLMEKVCKEFEAESDTDSEETKKSRFERVFNLMEEMQKLGQPPKDLVGDNSFLDENGIPTNMPNVDQCSLM